MGFQETSGFVSLNGGGDALRRFADDFKIANNGILSLPVCEEAFLAGSCVFKNVLDGIPNMQQIDTVVLHRGKASA